MNKRRRYKQAIMTAASKAGMSRVDADGLANNILNQLYGGKTMFTPKEKATAGTVAHALIQRSHIYQDTSTKVLSVQGPSIKNHQNFINLIASMGTTGVTNTKGGKRH